jgi:carboxypeptidase C (cathepsin A)
VFLIFALKIGQGVNKDHLVEKKLPNIDPSWMKSNWYSGSYMVSRNRGLHYLLIESERNESSDPLILYFGGGPG